MDKKILLIFIVGLLLVVIAAFGTMAPLSFTGNAVKEFKGASLCNKDLIIVDLYYDGNFQLLNKSLERGCSPNYLHEAGGRYSYDLQGENKSLYIAEFNPALIYHDADVEGGIEGGVENARTNIVLAAPSFENAEKLNVYDNKTKILTIDVYDVGATSCRVEWWKIKRQCQQ